MSSINSTCPSCDFETSDESVACQNLKCSAPCCGFCFANIVSTEMLLKDKDQGPWAFEEVCMNLPRPKRLLIDTILSVSSYKDTLSFEDEPTLCCACSKIIIRKVKELTVMVGYMTHPRSTPQISAPVLKETKKKQKIDQSGNDEKNE